MNTNNKNEPLINGQTRVCVHKVDEIAIFEVTEAELDNLEKGRLADIYLQFAIFLLSTALTTTITIFTVTFNSRMMETLFICCSVIGFIIGIFLLLIWYKNKDSVKGVIEKIRSRSEC